MRLHSTVLVTRNLERLRQFYTDILGFEVVDDFGACVVLSCGLSLWQPGDQHPVRPRDNGERGGSVHGFPFELCFEADTVGEFDAMAERLRRTGLPLLHGVRTERWGQRTLRVEDPDGNLVEWGESIPCFIRRMHAGSRSIAEVASATGVPAERVRDIVEATPSRSPETTSTP